MTRPRLARVRAAVRAGSGRLVSRGRGETTARPRVTGIVEQFSRTMVVGWVSVPVGSPPTRVSLHLADLQLAATTATPGDSMSGFNSVLRGRAGTGATPDGTPLGQAELAHRWQRPNVPGPPDDRRNSREEIRTFSFRLRDVWAYARPRHKLTVRADGDLLPIHGHGMFLTPPTRGKRSLEELRRLYDSGHVLSQYGRIQLSKRLDTEWQGKVIGLYDRCRRILHEHHGLDLFLMYGTLLGAVREGGYIGHDIDFDAAYVSRHSTGHEATQELVEVALALIAGGLDVEARYTALHVFDPDDHSARIDIFHTFFDEAGVWRFPFGVAGTSTVTRADWRGTEEIEFPGGRCLVPVNAEQLVAHLYGEDWRQPKPGFNWNLDRTDKAVGADTHQDQRTKVYWANFYAHMQYSQGSSFFELVNARPDTPSWVLDIGCGDGRDARAFGAAGRHVLGLDQSPVGVEHARGLAVEQGVADLVTFEVCDVADESLLTDLVSARSAQAEGPVLFYLRFFLHAIPEDVQATLLGVLAKTAREGDLLAAEFRTDKDAAVKKVHGNHYRRFQNAEEFAQRLTGEYSFTILHQEEGTGLSPYQDEDPVLCRVIARR